MEQKCDVVLLVTLFLELLLVIHDLSGATTTTFIAQFTRVWSLTGHFQLRSNDPDQIIWRWTAGGCYSSSSAYAAFLVGRTKLEGACEVWPALAPPKVKFFF
jgi:hypothetical protein